MRIVVSTLVVIGAVCVGYMLLPGAAAQDVQFGPAGLTIGEKVRLAYEPDRGSLECTVIGLRGDFVGCKNERQMIGQSGYTRWYNLRLIARVDRPAHD